MAAGLLLDEMLSDDIAKQLRNGGHDVVSVVARPAMVGLPDDQVLSHAAAERRALVTANIRDHVALDAQYRAVGRSHAGIVLVSTAAFPQDRSFVGAVVTALAALLTGPVGVRDDQVVFLARSGARRPSGR